MLVVEILLQQTQASRVASFIPAFFLEFPTPRSLLEVEGSELSVRIATLGLQKRRASRLKALAAAIEARDGRIPGTKEELQALPGVGPYVAAAFLSTVAGEPEAMVDVNMARFVERIYGPRELVDIRYDPHINGIATRLVRLAPSAAEFNWAVLDLAAIHCRARSPTCRTCPMLEVCPEGKARVGGTREET